MSDMGGDGLFLVVDGLGGGASTFKQGNFQKAVAAMGAEAEAARYGGKARKDTESDIYKIVKMIMERGYDPVIVFSFSKKDCERLALDMSTLDLIEEGCFKMCWIVVLERMPNLVPGLLNCENE